MKTTSTEGVTFVINHKIHESNFDKYENWIEKIFSHLSNTDGFLDHQVIFPITGFTQSYTIIVRFTDKDKLENWITSKSRVALLDEIYPYLEENGKYTIQNGMDFLFQPINSQKSTPKKWKQFLITWSAIFPLALIIPILVKPTLRLLHIQENALLDTFFVTGFLVLSMVYLIMPQYTKLIRRWLFN